MRCYYQHPNPVAQLHGSEEHWKSLLLVTTVVLHGDS